MFEVKNLTKSFGERTLFHELSFSVSDGVVTVVRGASGSGKTTLLRILAGLEKPEEGCIPEIGNVSYAFQEYRLFPTLSALENVSLVAKNKEKASPLLSLLGFSEEDKKKKPGMLSGGMKQRTSLARALLSEGDVLLLDEPTKELDPALVKTVLTLVSEEAKRRPVVLVTHRESDLETLKELGADLSVIDL